MIPEHILSWVLGSSTRTDWRRRVPAKDILYEICNKLGGCRDTKAISVGLRPGLLVAPDMSNRSRSCA